MAVDDWLRERRWRRQLRRWEAAAAYPTIVRRTYRTSDEQTRDAARLVAHGYRVVDDQETGGTVDVTPAANIYGRGSQGQLTVDLPLSHVKFERNPA